MATAYREYTAYLRFTVGATTYAWASKAGTRNSISYLGILSRWPAPTDSMQDSFGIVEADRFNIEVSDPTGTYLSLTPSLAGVEATLELVTRRVLTAGSPTEVVNTRKVTVESVTRLPGALSLELADLDRLRLDAEYPSNRYTVFHWPDLFIDHAGLPVPVVVGTALKVPFAYVTDNGGNGPWVYGGPQKLGTETVLTVYSEGRIVDPTEYTVGSSAIGGINYLTLSFIREQVDFQGSILPITADISGSVSRDAGAELHRIMTVAGLTPEFPAGSTFNTSNRMYVDTAYVQPRTFQAIIEDLLLILRGHLYRTATGGWQLVQDQVKASSLTLSESAGDLVEITGYTLPRRAQTVEVEYYQNNSAEPLNLKHVVSKSGGGASGKVRYIAPYLRDHEGADRLLDYLAKREQNAATATAIIPDQQITLGDVITLSNPLLWSGNKTFICQRITRAEDRNEVELREYVASIYTYTAGTLPADATRGYTPDYSLTFPDPPTNLTIVATQAAQNTDGSTSAWVKLTAKLPATNANRIGFSVSNNTTGELHTGPAEVTLGDPTVFQAVIPGLRPGQAYTALAWAISPFGLEGEAVSIGFTAGAWTATPASPGTISVTQGTGKSIRIVWSGVTTANLRHYVLQRGGVTIYTGNSTGYVDQDSALAYDATYTYRVRAEDRFGNASAWVTAVPFTMVRNIGGSDLPSGAIVKDHLADLLITAEKIASGAIDLGGAKVTGLLAEARMPVITDPTKIADNLIGNTKLINAAITASKIADGQIDLGGTKVAGLLSNARLAPITDSTKIANALIGKSHLAGAVNNLFELQIAAGINVGAVGNIKFIKNANISGDPFAGTIQILPGRLFLPDGSEVIFSSSNVVNTFYEKAVSRSPFYLVAGGSSSSTRFGTGFHGHNIFQAYYNAESRQWIAIGASDEQVIFTPAANDVIIAVGSKYNTLQDVGIDELSSLLTPFLLSSTNIDNFVASQAIGAAHIGNAQIGYAHIQAGSIDTLHVRTGAINEALIGSAVIGEVHIKDAAITEAKIKELSVGTAAIKTGAITDVLIANAAVGSAQIKAAAIEELHVGSGAIGNAAIQNLAVTNEKVGGIIQSSQTLNGRPRWKVDKNGAAEFSGVTIYDENGNIVLASGGGIAVAANGGNLVYNSAFDETTNGWTFGNPFNFTALFSRNFLPEWTVGNGTAYLQQTSANYNQAEYIHAFTDYIPVLPNQYYEASVYSGSHRANNILIVLWYDTGKAVISSPTIGTNEEEKPGGPDLSDYKRIFGIVQSPATAAYARVMVRKFSTKIAYSGQTSYAFFTRVMFAEASSGQTSPSPWSVGPITPNQLGAVRTDLTNAPSTILNSGITISANGVLTGAGGGQVSLFGLGAGGFATLNQITAGNISTYIASAAIGGAYIGAAQIGTAHIADGNITNAKIGGVIQSTEMLNGRPRWKIDKNGGAELSGVTIYDANGNVVLSSGGESPIAADIYNSVRRWAQTLPVSTSDAGRILNPNGDPISVSFDGDPVIYRITLKTIGTSTNTGYIALVRGNGSNAFTIEVLSQKGSTIDHPRLIIFGDNTVRASLYNEASLRTVSATIEQFDADLEDRIFLNSRITINPDGTLSNAGSGQVNLSGLGAGAFATLSALNATNIGTYISDAAINGALIKTAAIGTAHIGVAQIDTLRVAGNAITVPVSAYTDGSISLSNGTWVTVQSITINSSGSATFVHFSCVFSLTQIEASFRFLDGTTTVADFAVITDTSNHVRAFSFSFKISPSAGSHTYHAQILQSSVSSPSGSVSKRSLLMLEAKR